MPHFLRSQAFLIANASRSRAFAAFAKQRAKNSASAREAHVWSVCGVFMHSFFAAHEVFGEVCGLEFFLSEAL